jgi:hypothetical protein
MHFLSEDDRAKPEPGMPPVHLQEEQHPHTRTWEAGLPGHQEGSRHEDLARQDSCHGGQRRKRLLGRRCPLPPGRSHAGEEGWGLRGHLLPTGHPEKEAEQRSHGAASPY